MVENDTTTQHQPDNEVDVFYYDLDDHAGESRRLYRLLSDDEKQRADRYRFDVHRHRFISSRGKLREILAQRGQCQAEDIRFEAGRYGKPCITAPASLKQLHFNASASGPTATVAISAAFPLGFDIEQINYEKARDLDLIVKNQFTIQEQEWYRRHNPAERVQAFYTLWTCKEAYLKALGLGLSKGLDRFSVNASDNSPTVTHTELEDNEESALCLYLVDVADGTAACLATPEKNCNIRIIGFNYNKL